MTITITTNTTLITIVHVLQMSSFWEMGMGKCHVISFSEYRKNKLNKYERHVASTEKIEMLKVILSDENFHKKYQK